MLVGAEPAVTLGVLRERTWRAANPPGSFSGVRHTLTMRSPLPLLGIDPREVKTHKDTYAHTDAALLAVIQKEKQPDGPSAGQRLSSAAHPDGAGLLRCGEESTARPATHADTHYTVNLSS